MTGARAPFVGDRAVRIAAALLLQTALAWTDPKFTVFPVSSLKDEADNSSHPSGAEKENTCSLQNISDSFTAPHPLLKKLLKKKAQNLSLKSTAFKEIPFLSQIFSSVFRLELFRVVRHFNTVGSISAWSHHPSVLPLEMAPFPPHLHPFAAAPEVPLAAGGSQRALPCCLPEPTVPQPAFPGWPLPPAGAVGPGAAAADPSCRGRAACSRSRGSSHLGITERKTSRAINRS